MLEAPTSYCDGREKIPSKAHPLSRMVGPIARGLRAGLALDLLSLGRILACPYLTLSSRQEQVLHYGGLLTN